MARPRARAAIIGTLVVLTSWSPGAAVPRAIALSPATQLVSVDSAGALASGGSDQPQISAEGRYVAFVSYASNLVAGDTNNSGDAFVRDTVSGTTERVSVSTGGVQGDNNVQQVWLTPDARYVAFSSFATNLVVGDINGVADIFLRDRQLGTTERVSVGTAGMEANGDSDIPALSPDARFVVFSSLATNLVVGDTTSDDFDVFLHDRQTGVTERISEALAGGDANAGSRGTAVSADGRYVAFASNASNLVANDTNGWPDIFVKDRQAATMTRVSLDAAGNELSEGGESNFRVSMTPDGRFVGFRTRSVELLDGAVGYQAILYDRQTLTPEIVSRAGDGTPANGFSDDPFATPDGRFVTFWSDAGNLVTGDTNGTYDVFVRDRQTNSVTRASVAADGSQGNSYSYRQSISDDGRFVAFHSVASNLVPNDTNFADDIFIRDLAAPVAPGSDTASSTVAAGGTVTTGTGTASPSDPVETSVTPSVGGNVSISESSTITTPTPVGYSFLGQEVAITAPAGSVAQPIQIVFTVDGSVVNGTDASTIQVFRNGAVVAPCAPNDGAATPTPCVTARNVLGDGDVQIVVLTAQASVWNFAKRLPYAFTGFFSPVDNRPIVNWATAGSAIPVKFKLGGNQGLVVLAAGYPKSQTVACDTAATVDGIEQTASANSSGLAYDAGSGTYVYTWKTEKSWANTCRQLVLRFADGTSQRADFTFRK